MKWRRGAGGGIEDRRGMSGRRVGGGVGGLGLVGVIVVLLFQVLGGGGSGAFDVGPSLDPFPTSQPATDDSFLEGAQSEEELAQFVGFVVNDVQNFWSEAFAGAGREYPVTRLVLFRQGVSTACGTASSAVGPFYCPGDAKVYLDLGFFAELSARFGAPGDFAQAYVIAHEFGHHVQSVLGISEEVSQMQQTDPSAANELSVRLELQADCLAGVWAHSAYEQGQLEEGDLEEGLAAAAAVGDDRLQRAATGTVDPDSFTHGSSAQRQGWFLTGFRGGELAACDTFSAEEV